MTDKSPREQLEETLRAATERVRALPDWVREAISTDRIFHVARVEPPSPREPDGEQAR